MQRPIPKPSPPHSPRKLAPHAALRGAILKARNETGLGQSAVAERAGISARTVAAIETETGSYIPRPAIVARIALALGRNAQEFLHLAGYEELPQSQIEKIQQSILEYPLKKELDPKHFFESLRDELSRDTPILLNALYTSPPGLQHREDVQTVIAELIDRGLWLSMSVPYPRVGQTEYKPHLAGFYASVYREVLTLAFSLLIRVKADNRKQLAVFAPKIPVANAEQFFIMPPISTSETRSALIRFYNRKTAAAFTHELGAWVTFAQDHRDSWYTFYSRRKGNHIGPDELLWPWLDYFNDVISSCDPLRGTGWDEQTRMGSWEKLPLAVPAI